MDDDTLASRVERTLWTVWNYLTGAVNRLLRPESTSITRSDLNSPQEAAVDSGPAKCHTEDGVRGTDVDEEQPLSKVSVVSSSRTVVAWELCTDISGRLGEESVPCKTEQVNRGSESKASSDSESTGDEDFVQPRNDDAGLFFIEDAKGGTEEESKVQKLFTDEPDEMQENDEHEEHVKTMSLLAGDAISEDVVEGRRKSGGVEETETAMTDDLRKIAEIMTKIKTAEEDKQPQHGDKQNLKAEDTEVKVCMTMALRGEEVKVQRDGADVDGAVMNAGVEGSDVVLQLEGATQGENQLSVCDELPDADRDFKADADLISLRVGLHMADGKNVTVSVGNKMSRRSESDKVEGEGEQGAVTEEESVTEAADNQTINRLPENEDDKKSVPEDSQEEQVSAGLVPRGESFVQNSESELDSAEFTDGEHEDMMTCTAVQTNTKRTDSVPTESRGEAIALRSDLTTAVSIDERCLVEDQAKEEKLSSKAGDEDCYTERANAVGSLPVKPEGNAEREIREHFKNIPLGICEGRLVGSPERHSPTCEETHEGVPEYNNEPRPDENTARRFLEVRDGGGVQNRRLPEEAESREPESLQSSGTGLLTVDCLVVRNRMEEDEEDNPYRFNLVMENRSAELCRADAGLPQEMDTPLTEAGEADGKLLVDSQKIGIRHSEKELERHAGLSDEMAKRLRNETEELLVEFGMDEGLCEVNEGGDGAKGCEMPGAMAAEEVVKCADESFGSIEAEAQEMTETSNVMEPVDYMMSEPKNRRALNSREDFTESGFLKQSVGTSDAEMQNARIDKEKMGHEVEEKAAEDRAQSKNDMELLNLQVVGWADELITERKEKENTLNAKSHSREMQHQLSDETSAISNEDTEGAPETMAGGSKPKDATVRSAEIMRMTEAGESCAEETGAPNNERQDVIDQEILDLWIHAALSEDTVGMKRQDWPESGQQMQTEMEASSEEQDETSLVLTGKDDEQLVEWNSVESELVNVAEMSSSTAESGFSDQSLCDCGAQSGETQLLDSTSSGSFQDVGDLSESASISELLMQQPNSWDTLVKDNNEAQQSRMKEEESSEAGHLNRDLEKSQGIRDTEAALEREIDDEIADFPGKAEWEDDEGADAEMDALFEAEETKVADKLPEVTMSGAPDEIDLTDSNRFWTGSASLQEEGIVPTGSGSQKNACCESGNDPFELPSLDKPHPLWSEGVADTLSGPKTADDAEELPTEFGMGISVLDLTVQRSRIAVKNPRVRPPKNPRALVHMPSVNPTPSSRLPVKIPPKGVPLGGFGIGIKLPGLGSGLPTLKKTQQVVRGENSLETFSQEPESKPEEKSGIPKQDEAKVKLKPMPPKHPGFTSPLMSELKTKLKKTTKYDDP